jgi:hypothetical protein
MQLTTLDIITRRTLLETGHPIHYYFEFLTHAATCLRELNIDTLQIINTKNLPVGEYGQTDFPLDFQDEVGISFPINGNLTPIPKKDNISPLRLLNSDGTFVPYNEMDNHNGQNGFFFNYFWFWNISDYGEGTGRNYGVNGGSSFGYKKVKERRQFQFTQNIVNTNVVLMYISDGQSVDSATQIDIAAFATIQAWINWKRSFNRDNDYSPEGRSFYNQKSKLRSRLNELTLVDVREVLRSNYIASPKT